MRIRIDSFEEYQLCRVGFIEPLLMPNLFEITNRKQIVRVLYPLTSPETDHRFYVDMWNMKSHWCENCGLALKEYSSVYISHIYSRGAFTEIRYDPLNINILCSKCHNKWEFGNEEKRKTMFIYYKNREHEEELHKVIRADKIKRNS